MLSDSCYSIPAQIIDIYIHPPKMGELKEEPSLELRPATQKDEDVVQGSVTEIAPNTQSLHRSLRGAEVQLFAIGGAIGTCMLKLTDSDSAYLQDG